MNTEYNTEWDPALESASDTDPSNPVKKKRPSNLIVRIASLLLAFLLWCYVSSFDSSTFTKTFTQIPVEIENSGTLSVLSGSGAVIDVTLSGSKSAVNNVSSDEIRAYVDVSDVTEAGKRSFPIRVDAPNGVSVSSKSFDNITVYMDNTTSVTVPIRLKLTDYMIDEGFELGETDAVYSTEEVTVTGPENALKDIRAAQLTVQLGHITSSVTCKGSLELVNEAGNVVSNAYIRMKTSEISAFVPLYEYKTVPLTVDCKYGYFNDEYAEIAVSPETVTVKGETEHVSALDAIRVTTLDEKSMTGDSQYVCSIPYPDGVVPTDGTEKATVSVHHVGTATKDLILDTIKVNNPSGLSYELLTESLKITLRGPSSYLSYLTPNNVEASVDLGNISNASGTVIVPVTVTVGRLYASNVYELGSYSVSVRVK